MKSRSETLDRFVKAFLFYLVMDYSKNLDLEPIKYFCEFDKVFKIEQWKPILNYEDYYQVSDLGRVKTLPRFIKNGQFSYLKKENMLKSANNGEGYKMVVLYNKICKKSFKVHRLVAYSFLDNPNNLEMVNHKDEIKCNNFYKNLEWVTRRENGVHRYKNKNTTSKYCGVSWSKSNNKWYSSIRFNGKKIAIGMFVDEIEAYNARVEFEKENGITNKYL